MATKSKKRWHSHSRPEPSGRREKVCEGPNPYLDFKKLDPAAEIAYYYGFMPIKTPSIKPEDVSAAKKLTEGNADHVNFGSISDCPINISVDEKIAVLRACFEKNIISQNQPTMIYYESVVGKEGNKIKLPRQYKKINLEIIGTTKSVAEAILMQTAIEIIKEEGYEDLYIDLNSVGDKESIANFTRELNNFNRKNAGELPSGCRHELRGNLLHLFQCKHKKCEELRESAPKSVTNLTEFSRIHLKEVLEYIESLNVPYKLDNSLMAERRMVCHTLFKIVSLGKGSEPEETVALGFRYNGLSKKAELGRDLPAIGITISLKRKSGHAKHLKNPKKPKLYFIQLGFEAKVKSLKVIEILRKAKIPLYQSLSRDKLSSQLLTAENMRIPVAIIMGQKEALENSVIVRNMTSRFQESVSLDNLADYLKKFRLA